MRRSPRLSRVDWMNLGVNSKGVALEGARIKENGEKGKTRFEYQVIEGVRVYIVGDIEGVVELILI